MTKLLPWVICFDVTMPQEVFNLLHEGVISYGLDVLELAWFSDNKTPRGVSVGCIGLRIASQGQDE